MPEPNFTVAICSYRRPALLRLCLESLAGAKDLASTSIVVVNNGGDAETDDVVREFTGRLRIEGVVEERIGLSHARNRAWRDCSTPYIVYLDDDAKVDPHWGRAIRDGLGRWKYPDFFGGPYRPYYLDARPNWFDDEYASEHGEKTEGRLQPGQHVSGGNMGWRVSLLEELGGFPENLGMIGGSLGLGEETSLQNRLHEERPEVRGVFFPAMSILHYVAPEKMSLGYMWRRAWTYGRQLGQIAPSAPAITWHDTKQELLLPGRLLVRLVLRNRARYPYWSNYACHCLTRSAVYWGTLFGRLMPEKRAGGAGGAGTP